MLSKQPLLTPKEVTTISKTLEEKKEEVAQIKELLEKSKLAVVIDYQGLTVAEIGDLRNRLRDSGTICKVTKNSLMNKATEDYEDWQPISEFLKGQSAFILADEENIGSAIRAYNSFVKEKKKTECRGGVMEGQALTTDQVKALADLPTKDELMAQIAGAINAVATKIARGINEVPASLARAIDAVKAKQEEG